MSAKVAARGKEENRRYGKEIRPRASYVQELMGKHLPDLRSLEEYNGKMNRNIGRMTSKPKVEGLIQTPEKLGRRDERHWDPV